MTVAQVRYRLKWQGYRLRKRDDRYMIVDSEHNYAVAGAEGDGYSLSLDDVADFLDG